MGFEENTLQQTAELWRGGAAYSQASHRSRLRATLRSFSGMSTPCLSSNTLATIESINGLAVVHDCQSRCPSERAILGGAAARQRGPGPRRCSSASCRCASASGASSRRRSPAHLLSSMPAGREVRRHNVTLWREHLGHMPLNLRARRSGPWSRPSSSSSARGATSSPAVGTDTHWAGCPISSKYQTNSTSLQTPPPSSRSFS